jgi:hypothetical protein
VSFDSLIIGLKEKFEWENFWSRKSLKLVGGWVVKVSGVVLSDYQPVDL